MSIQDDVISDHDLPKIHFLYYFGAAMATLWKIMELITLLSPTLAAIQGYRTQQNLPFNK